MSETARLYNTALSLNSFIFNVRSSVTENSLETLWGQPTVILPHWHKPMKYEYSNKLRLFIKKNSRLPKAPAIMKDLRVFLSPPITSNVFGSYRGVLLLFSFDMKSIPCKKWFSKWKDNSQTDASYTESGEQEQKKVGWPQTRGEGTSWQYSLPSDP